MPPKVLRKGRGRKKAIEVTTDNKPSKDENSNGDVKAGTSENVEEKANGIGNSNEANDSDSMKLKETKNTKELVKATNGKSQINGILEKDSNLITEVAPLKRGRKKAIIPAENEVPAKTIDLVSAVDEDSKELPTNNGHEVTELPTSESPNKNISEDTQDNDNAEPDNKKDISDDENKVEVKEVPLKRGRLRNALEKASEETPDEQLLTEEVQSKRGRKKANPLQPDNTSKLKKVDEEVKEEPSEETPDEQPETEEVQSKRGRKKANPLQLDKTSKLKKVEEEVEEEPSEKTQDAQLQAEEKVPSKRGRKKANLLQSDIPSNVKKSEDDVQEEEPSKRGRKKANPKIEEDVNEETSNVPSKELMPLRRGRRKANQKETVEGSSDEESKKPNQDIAEKVKSGRNAKNVEASKNATYIKNEKQESKELSSEGRKRKNETSAEEIEKNKSDFNETKVLKVALQRDLTIDQMFEEQTKVSEKGGAKNTKTGGKRTKEEDADPKETGVKSPKVPKGESKSKGQSKKDKMPDVTLLDFNNNSTSPSGKPWNLKISSWNVNGLRAWLVKDGLAYIAHENPDIMAFQETKCSDKMLPKEVNIAGYHSYWLAGDKDGYSGVGLLSKKEPISIKYGIGVEEHDNEGRVVTAEYETFYLVAAYIPNAGRELVRLSYRMQWDKYFRSYIKSLDEKKPVVLCGDLNVAHEEIDLANPKTNKKNAGFTKEEREGFSALLSEGFIDSFRHLYPDEKGAYTFWTYMMNARSKNVGWRLDYFVLSKKFTDHLCDSVIRKDVFGSDHCPITLFLSV